MRDFERKGGRLAALSFHARLVYTIFLVFTLLALGLSGWLVHEMVGVDLQGLDAYYAGEVETPDRAPAPVPGEGSAPGPALDLPGDLESTPGNEPLSLRKLLEVTHFHLFSMPVYLLVLSHLFMLSRARSWVKTLWIAAGTAGTALHIAAPWAATGGGATAAAVYAISGIALLLSFTVMSLRPLWEMWRP